MQQTLHHQSSRPLCKFPNDFPCEAWQQNRGRDKFTKGTLFHLVRVTDANQTFVSNMHVHCEPDRYQQIPTVVPKSIFTKETNANKFIDSD